MRLLSAHTNNDSYLINYPLLKISLVNSKNQITFSDIIYQQNHLNLIIRIIHK